MDANSPRGFLLGPPFIPLYANFTIRLLIPTGSAILKQQQIMDPIRARSLRGQGEFR